MHCYVMEQCEEDGSSLYIEHGICAFVLNWVYAIVENDPSLSLLDLATIQASIAIVWDIKLLFCSHFPFFLLFFEGYIWKLYQFNCSKYSATWIKSRWLMNVTSWDVCREKSLLVLLISCIYKWKTNYWLIFKRK